MIERDMAAATEALLTLAEYNIPADVQELLVFGNPERGVPPGALSAAIGRVLISFAETVPPAGSAV